jgi:hypothetical protein
MPDINGTAAPASRHVNVRGYGFRARAKRRVPEWRDRQRAASEATHSISISIFGSGSAWTTLVVRAG